MRSDNGAEFTAAKVMRWLRDNAIGPAFIATGSPWQDGVVESLNGKGENLFELFMAPFSKTWSLHDSRGGSFEP